MKWLSFLVQCLVVGLVCNEISKRYLLVELDGPENTRVEVAGPEKTREFLAQFPSTGEHLSEIKECCRFIILDKS